MNIQKTATALRSQLTKEISGFVSIFGSRLDLLNKQQLDAVKSALDPANAYAIDLESSFPELHSSLNANGLKRLVADNGLPDKLMFLQHTWSQCDDVSIDSLLQIHAHMEAHLAATLHRSVA